MSTDKWALVAKYLDALQKDTFNPKSAHFQVTWMAVRVRDPTPQEQYEVMTLECRKSGMSNLSKEAMAGFVGLLACQLMKAESYNLFNLQLLQALQNLHPGLKTLKHEISPLIIKTARAFALPPLHPPHPLLLAKDWSRDGESGTLPYRLWLYIAEFLSPTVQQQWLDDASHPLVFLDLNEFQNVIGWNLVQPPGVDARQFFSRTLWSQLVLNGVQPQMDWESAGVESLQRLLERNVGLPRGSLDQHVDLQFRGALHAAGLCMRLKARVPSLLVGDFGADADIALCKVVSSMLQSRLVVLHARSGVDVSDPDFQASLADAPLLLIRCVQEDRHGVDMLQRLVIKQCCGQSWTVGSLHYVRKSAAPLQQQLPRQLRESVLFI